MDLCVLKGKALNSKSGIWGYGAPVQMRVITVIFNKDLFWEK